MEKAHVGSFIQNITVSYGKKRRLKKIIKKFLTIHLLLKNKHKQKHSPY